ncbi:hypothetical protein GOP47_0018963 [Adiantum capillus-veneris]|uniref:Pre-mRNA-splicing factor SYF2 n=1 Tax=Adiantum capillus-veneris TaxID=13818 RepID=A0A9D4Z992_ADICA|nr:hypothetical protein GOP47_0018963 [Adiantum capillus-veneris]
MAERRVHPDCINSSNPYHECSDYCFRRISEAQMAAAVASPAAADAAPALEAEKDSEILSDGKSGENSKMDDYQETKEEEEEPALDPESYAKLTPMQRKMFDLRLKLNAARKANQTEIVAEKKRAEAPVESRGVSKQKWFEEKQKRLGKHLELNGLEKSKAFMLDTQDAAEVKYKKWENKPAPFGWDVFNQRSLYNAYKKRTKNIPYSMEDYMKAKESDPDFFRDGSSLQYGKAPDIPEENVDKMVAELEDRDRKRKSFSRRRKFHEEKDIDSINDRNEHFNRKIERAFGKYTVEIKNNLERGTALPD